MKILKIEQKNQSIVFIDTDIGKRCDILTESYGEVTSYNLNKTEVKRVINWLSKWIKRS